MLKKILVTSFLLLGFLAGAILPAKADDNNGNKPTASVIRPQVDTVCMAAAVAAREIAIANAFTTFSTTMQSAFSARASALASAWTLTNAKTRNKAINEAWKTFRKTKNETRAAHAKAIKTTWKQFGTSAKACQGSANEASGGQGYDMM